MIVQITYNGTDYYIDSELILYGFDDTGLNLVLNQKALRYNPAAEIFESNSLQAVSTPTYATFVTDTADFHFLEISHATYGTICVNLDRIKRLEDVGGTDTNIIFEIGATVQVDVAIGTLENDINTALAPSGGVTDGDKGDITVSGGGTIWTIDNLAVTDAKINDVDASKVTTNTTQRFVTDAEKSTWNGKQDTLVSSTNIKTINGSTILGSGDLVVSGTGGTVYQTEVDFGTTPVSEALFVVAHTGATSSSKITASLAYDAPTGKDLDELDMDNLIIKAGANTTNSFNLYITTADGSYLADTFKINYLITL